jgi:N-acetylglutamate synthase-like GNAT family acetyltransferase
MSDFKIQEFIGPAASPIVLPLYQAEGNGISIRDTDIFFVGFLQGTIVGSVRFCVEDGTPMLRTMRIAQRFQRQGYGHCLLRYFESYLERNGIKATYCLPYAHLESFYGSIGFKTVKEDLAPVFLQERLAGYRAKSGAFICMGRQ